MRRTDAKNMYSSRAYYFSVLSLILLLVERGVAWTLSVPGNRLPSSLGWITLILAVVSACLCVLYAIKGRNGPATAKKVVMWVLTFIVILFVIYVLRQRLIC
jgi:hypothetical protein